MEHPWVYSTFSPSLQVCSDHVLLGYKKRFQYKQIHCLSKRTEHQTVWSRAVYRTDMFWLGYCHDTVTLRYGTVQHGCGSVQHSCGTAQHGCGTVQHGCGTEQHGWGTVQHGCGTEQHGCGTVQRLRSKRLIFSRTPKNERVTFKMLLEATSQLKFAILCHEDLHSNHVRKLFGNTFFLLPKHMVV